ncbi:MAG: thrombospondin type 3 repeat-containing protein [Kiritimatiellae bacterium]|nr:thrombospondin type 3 repeat-containing protein [Kiritimatiellia bacterium]MDW8458753.1 hypothetical protein [Verrucomicrobiota bacterium]
MKSKIGWITLVAVLGWTAPLRALQVPLNFAITNQVFDEFGNIVPGTSAAAPDFGIPYVEGAIVQILGASAGVFPPGTNGTPHPDNPVIKTFRIGQGASPEEAQPGTCSGSIDTLDRSVSPPTNVFIMARVFNKPSLDEASFYADSQLFQVPFYGAPSYQVFFAEVGATTNQLDPTDHDGDGLTRSWEKSYGTDPDNPDTDGDAMIDGHEIRAGTNPLDVESLLIMVQIEPLAGDDLLLTWDAVPGKQYQLQYVEALTNGAEFVNLNDPVMAISDTASTVVTNGTLNPNAVYRVKLVE